MILIIITTLNNRILQTSRKDEKNQIEFNYILTTAKTDKHIITIILINFNFLLDFLMNFLITIIPKINMLFFDILFLIILSTNLRN